tara:strand:- start:12468 stop:12926 length:459 start_codon:yes stop_codon:yes gene_type:complete
MKKLLTLFLYLTLIFSCTQNKPVQDPVDAVNILFKVAETKEFELLSLICDLDKLELIDEGASENSDACSVCLLEKNFVSECGQNSDDRDGFINMFSRGYINGEVKTYFTEVNSVNIKCAEVPVMLFRNNEMIKMTINVFQDNSSNRWYLADL